MKGALVILAALILIGLILRLTDPLFRRSAAAAAPETSSDEEERNTTEEEMQCCGQHLVCEKRSLAPLDTVIEYFDDEELDRLAGRDPLTFTPAETEELRDVLLTLPPDEVPAWVRSLQLRRIAVPEELRDEILLIAADIRFGKA